MGTFLNNLHNLLLKYRWSSLVLLILLISFSLFSVTKLTFVEDISRVLPQIKNTDKLDYVLKESTLMNKIVFDIHMADDENNIDLLVDYADSISNFLERDSVEVYFKSLQLRVDDTQMLDVLDVVNNNIPLFLSENDYDTIESRIKEKEIKKLVESGYNNLISPLSIVSSKYFIQDPLGLSFIGLNKIKNFNLDNDFSLYKNRLVNKEKSDVLLFANLDKNNTQIQNALIISWIHEYVRSLKTDKFIDVDIEIFGGAIVANENSIQAKEDVLLTVLITVVLLILLVSYFFRKRRAVFVIFIPTILGSILALGFFTLFNNQISVISLSIGAVLLGMSIDFSLHVYSHFREYHSISKLFSDVSAPILLSTSTTIVAFLSLMLVESEVLNDLGVFVSLAIFCSSFFTLTLLPVLISLNSSETKNKETFLDKLSYFEPHKNKYVMLLIMGVTVFFFLKGDVIPFDADMMHSNYMSDKTKFAESRINSLVKRNGKELYIISTASSLDSVLEQNSSLIPLLDSLVSVGLVSSYSGVNSLLKSKSEQHKYLQRWEQFWKKNFKQTYKNLDTEGLNFGFRKDAFKKFKTLIDKEYDDMPIEDEKLISDLILNDFIIKSDSLRAAITILKVDDTRQVKAIVDSNIKNDNIWVYNSQLFISSLIIKLNDNMTNLVYYSLFFVFIILLIYYGRIELTIITMIPIVFGYIWTIGIMSLLNIQFNIFNIIVLSFIFGLGIDYGIFVTKGVLQKYTSDVNVIKEYKSSILLSFFTTIIAVGSLIFAQHPAMRSIAIMAIIGIASTLVVTFTIQPLVLNFIFYNKGKKREKPFILIDFLFSIFSLISFVFGSVLLTGLSFVFRLIPFGTKFKKAVFHKLLQLFSWWMMYANFLIKKIIINPNNEDFSKPSVIIANHQSHADVMLLLLLHPKLLILTNDREWNHKLYGNVLKYADFLPVSLPIDILKEEISKRVNLGYSVVVFPEGTRSKDGKMKKFQRGAFLIARELKLDILPIIFHGNDTLLTKQEFTVRRGQVTTKFLPRIDVSSGEYGNSLMKQSKSIYKILNDEYIKLKTESETPSYFRSKLILSYIFRSPVLEWYMRIKTKMENNYSFFNDLIPRDAKVSDLGCGYGFLIYTLSQTSENRSFIGVDFDSSKITIAKNNSLINDKIQFVNSDLTNYSIENSDVILINDVLHYITKDKRRKVVLDAFNKLNEKGFLVIRDGDSEMKEKHKVTKFSEFLSTFTNFNKAKFKNLEFLSRNEIIDLANELGAQLEIIDNTKFTSNVIYILRS